MASGSSVIWRSVVRSSPPREPLQDGQAAVAGGLQLVDLAEEAAEGAGPGSYRIMHLPHPFLYVSFGSVDRLSLPYSIS
jgi:hypothetical protein